MPDRFATPAGTDTEEEEPKRYQCRHIFSDGRRCGSPGLRDEPFCYYHHTTRRPAARTRGRKLQHAEFDLPNPEDRGTIQLSIGEIMRRVARNEIDPKRAGLLLYALQIASSNLPRDIEPAKPDDYVDEFITHPTLGVIAPVAEIQDPKNPHKGFAKALIEEFHRHKAEAAAQDRDEYGGHCSYCGHYKSPAEPENTEVIPRSRP